MSKNLASLSRCGVFREAVIVVGCCVLTFSSAALAQSSLVSPPLAGYKIGYEASNGTQSIREEIPERETIENWTSMITTQRFARSRLTALQFAEAMQRRVNEACEENSMSEPAELDHQGFEAASYSATCFNTPPHGGSETFFLMAVRTPDALLVKQVAFRGVVTDENLRFAVRTLRNSTVCEHDCDGATQ